MKTEVKRIQVDEKDMNYLQRLNFEVASRNDVITTLIENHALDHDDAVLTSTAFLTYSKQLSELRAELELAKQQISEKYLPDEFKDHPTAIWEADFASSEIAIKV